MKTFAVALVVSFVVLVIIEKTSIASSIGL
jgi:hypothetical protein